MQYYFLPNINNIDGKSNKSIINAKIIISAHMPPKIKFVWKLDCNKNRNPQNRQTDATMIGYPTYL